MLKSLLVIAALAALVAATGSALADKPPPTPGPKAGLPAKAKAYGRYCQNQSKKHVPGQQGTPFSRCVTAMAKLAHGESNSPVQACRTLSHKRVAGSNGTPFSRCVTAGAHLLADRSSAP